MTQSERQHRCRAVATASRADLPGRYPYESPWKHGSTKGSRCILTTICATRGLRDLDETHRRREVTPRGHPIPDLVEVILQVGLERLDGLTVHPGGALVGLDPLVCLPDHLLGNRVRLGLSHRFLPSRVGRWSRHRAARTTLLPA